MRHTLRKLVDILDGKPTKMKGQSLVEMAVSFPLLIFLILAIAEVGFFANNYLTLLDVVRESSRRGVSIDQRQWPDGEARNLDRLDCDTDGRYQSNKFGAETGFVSNGSNSLKRGGRLASLGYTSKGDSQADGYGPFDFIACYALSVMDPVEFGEDPLVNQAATTPNPAIGRDDIVVSIISYAFMNYDELDATNANKDYIAAAQIAINNQSRAGQSFVFNENGKQPTSRYWATVTGRWPLENRFCTNGDPNNPRSDSRDPFDYLRTDRLTRFVTRRPGVGGAPSIVEIKTVRDGFDATIEADMRAAMQGTLGTGQNEMFETEGNDPAGAKKPYRYVIDPTVGNSQRVRGYVFTGKAFVNIDNGSTTDETGNVCYGSRFTVDRIEQYLNNLLGTQQRGSAATRLAATQAGTVVSGQPVASDVQTITDQLAKRLPSSGIVIVEMHWQYHPRFFGPLFNGFVQGDTTQDPMIYVYSMFTVSAAEPTATP